MLRLRRDPDGFVAAHLETLALPHEAQRAVHGLGPVFKGVGRRCDRSAGQRGHVDISAQPIEKGQATPRIAEIRDLEAALIGADATNHPV